VVTHPDSDIADEAAEQLEIYLRSQKRQGEGGSKNDSKKRSRGVNKDITAHDCIGIRT